MAAELGPIFERKVLQHKLVIVSGPQFVEELNDESRFAKFLSVPHRKLRKVAADGLFTAFNSEENWGRAHRILMPGFSQAALRLYHRTMVEVGDELTSAWDASVAAGGVVDVVRDTNKLTLETIARCGFSHSFRSFDTDDDPFASAIVRSLAYVNETSNKLPWTGLLGAARRARQHDSDIALLQQVVDEVVETRLADLNERHHDLLDLMLHSRDPESGELLDHVNVRNQVLTFLIAGNETTAGTIAFALYFMAAHPTIADRARNEIDQLWPESQALPYEGVSKLRLVRRIIDETLRLWPAAPGYFRKARTNTSLDAGRYPMKAGDWAFVLTLALHRDPSSWTDPEIFDPDRFSTDNVRSRSGHSYKPFGTGARACIGRQFALHEAVLVLATLLRRYTFELTDDGPPLVREAITLRPETLRLKIQPRGLD